jgi:hypothetical protein
MRILHAIRAGVTVEEHEPFAAALRKGRPQELEILFGVSEGVASWWAF